MTPNEQTDYTKASSDAFNNAKQNNGIQKNNTRIEIKSSNPSVMTGICHLFMMIGSIITFIRNTVFNIIFIILVIAIFSLISFSNSQYSKASFFMAGTEDTQNLKKSSVLYLNLNGPILETPLSDDDYAVFSRQLDEKLNNRATNDILSIEEALADAATNPNIKTLYVNVSNLGPTSIPVAIRVARAIRAFAKVKRTQNTIAYADNYTAAGYMIASACKRIALNPFGGFSFRGFASSSLYYKDLFNKLNVEPLIFKAGEFKSAVEPFTSDHMSDGVKAEYTHVFTKLWDEYINELSVSPVQKKTLASLYQNVGEYLSNLNSTLGSEALLLKKYALITDVLSKQQVDHILIEQYGASKNDFTKPNTITYQQYLALKNDPDFDGQLDNASDDNDHVAVIYGIGNIVDKSSDPMAFTPNSIKSQIDKIYKDKSVKAVVLYLNSGGGSVTASEQIREYLTYLKTQRKLPIYVSMNGLCASGAYWIATVGDKVFATKETITGSIGVFSIGMSLHGLLNEYGVYEDGVETSEFARNEIARPVSKAKMIEYTMQVNMIYKEFISLVAKARSKLKIQNYKDFAEGRIFMADDAKSIGLVDEIASLDETIIKAKESVFKGREIEVKHISPMNTESTSLIKDIFFSYAYGNIPNDYVKLGLDLLKTVNGKNVSTNDVKPKIMAVSQLDSLAF